jgi:all-trans-retinol 13,14-reductase
MREAVSESESTRRDVIRAALAAVPLAGFDWDAWPAAKAGRRNADEFDAVIIGSGLGGLSCAASFARKGYRPLVLEQHDKAGGYATAFRRPGGFVFDVSLHSTSVGERNGVRNLIGGFPEITEVEFVPHPHLYRAIFPEHDIRVPQRDLPGYVALLVRLFPEEKPGIEGLIKDVKALSGDIGRFSIAQGKVDMSRFPAEFPMLYRCSKQTWEQTAAARIRDPKLKAVLSALWIYYGLPPSRLSTFYYALPTLGYLETGGYYPKGRSQTISNALVKFIEGRGGRVLLRTRVERILTKDGAAYGVRCSDGQEFRGRAVVSNASAWHTFYKFLEDNAVLAEYKARMAGFSTSLSCFHIFLGLKKDLVGQLGVKDSEVFVESGYDLDASYDAARKADVARCSLGLCLYDNLFRGYSPKGKNTINLLALQGFDHWEQFESDYRKGRKTAYQAEKQRMANILIRRAEEVLLPGLSKAVEVKEIGTPLTNIRYTGNYRGAIYGWDQTLDNSGASRVGHATPVKNLYLASAWTRPGHGYNGVLQSGLDCFAEIVRNWG